MLSGGVLVATDGSPSAVRAEAIAATISAGSKCKLVVVTISRGLPGDEIRQLAHTEGDVSAARHALIERILGAASERAHHAGVAEIKTMSHPGDPATVIVELAKREEVDLIVVGRRGINAISQLLLGSVSKAVVDRAPCAVTVVP